MIQKNLIKKRMKTISKKIILAVFFNSVLMINVSAEIVGYEGGHLKYQFLVNTLSDDSLFLDYVDTPMIDNNADLRLKFNWNKNGVALLADYQFIVLSGDSIVLAENLPAAIIIPPAITSDDNRLFDLTHVISDGSEHVIAHRLDRLYVEYTDTKWVARFGRQAISWGNGLVYTPMDFINPFDPSAIDKEYKSGDDMLYSQYLQQSGNDVQLVWVLRRDDEGDVTNSVDSIAAKYHGFIGNNEYDLLVSQHYNDSIIGVGGITDIGGAIWRGDYTLTHTRSENSFIETEEKNISSVVTSLTYSWVSWGHNMSGTLEYFYNGFGQSNGDYSPSALAENPELVERVQRGELFTLGRNYLVASTVVEVNPLWLLTPNVFINLNDESFLAQLVSTYDLKENWQLLAAISVPVGEAGTEYGGIDSGVAGKQLGTELNFFAQLAWYF